MAHVEKYGVCFILQKIWDISVQNQHYHSVTDA